MKKIIKILLSCFMLLVFTVPTHAASGTDYGNGYTLKGTISNTTIQGTATGTNSSNVNVALTNVTYRVGGEHKAVPADDKSAMTYVYYYSSSLNEPLFLRFLSVKVIGTLLSNSETTSVSLTNY